MLSDVACILASVEPLKWLDRKQVAARFAQKGIEISGSSAKRIIARGRETFERAVRELHKPPEHVFNRSFEHARG